MCNGRSRTLEFAESDRMKLSKKKKTGKKTLSNQKTKLPRSRYVWQHQSQAEISNNKTRNRTLGLPFFLRRHVVPGGEHSENMLLLLPRVGGGTRKSNGTSVTCEKTNHRARAKAGEACGLEGTEGTHQQTKRGVL